MNIGFHNQRFTAVPAGDLHSDRHRRAFAQIVDIRLKSQAKTGDLQLTGAFITGGQTIGDPGFDLLDNPVRFMVVNFTSGANQPRLLRILRHDEPRVDGDAVAADAWAGLETDVPLVMMAATKIGERQGQELYKEMQKRQWDVKATGVLAITADELDTARRRVEGSLGALKAAGFPEGQIFRAPTKSNDIPGALDAANSMLVQHPEVKNWLIVGMNDNTVLGGVRATEGQGFKAENVIGIGINGVDAVNELSKSSATGFLGSLLPSPDVHGYKSIQMLHDWVVNGAEPAKFTEVTDVVLITRDNFKAELQKKGL